MKIYPFFLPHAGCPHRCSFCNQSIGAAPQPPTPAAVARWLDDNLPASGSGEVAFYGGTFTLLDPSLQQAYCGAVAPFVRAGRVCGVRVSTRPDALSAEGVQRLKVGGVLTVELGCQSFARQVLVRCRRDYDAGTIETAVARLRRAGLAVGLQLMPGLPDGDRDEALDSLRQALRLRPDCVRIYPALVLADTDLAAEYDRGEYQPWSLEQAVDICADMQLLCQHADIPVIRMGLQATPELEDDKLRIAGPYHPAFGQLVRSRLWRRALARLLARGERQIHIHRADLADALGQRRENFSSLVERYGDFDLLTQPAIARQHLLCGGCSYSLFALTA